MNKSPKLRSIGRWTFSLLAALAAMPKASLALWEDSPIKLDQLHSQRLSISVLPDSLPADANSNNKNFSLTHFGTIDFAEGVKRYIQQNLANPFLGIQTAPPTLSLVPSAKNSAESIEYQLTASGVPICDSHIKAHKLWNGKSIILGTIPQLELLPAPSSDDWPRLDLAMQTTEDHLSELGLSIKSKKVTRTQRCFAQRGNNLVPAWNIVLVVNDLGYRVIADGYEILKFENLYFDISGQVKAYDTNPLTGTMKTYDIELVGDTHLTSEFFTTVTNARERAANAKNAFLYDPTDFRFEESSAFAHGALMLEYFRTLGYTWHGPKPLNINVHAIVNSSQNNALYQPADATNSGFPEISIGDGDGNILTNLPVDSDVISHEFSHHIIYQTLTSVSGESLVIHEGLADYFTFSRTNDSCLGESICPADSLACAVKGQCLRTADNDVKYKTPSYTKLEAHLQGQLVSGYLWDLHTKGTIPAADVTKILYTAISYFAKNSGFRDLVLALLLADNSETAGKYCQQIYDGAVSRGLGDLISDLSCSSDAASWGKPSGVSSPSVATQPVKRSTKKSKGGLFSCGVTGHQGGEALSLIALLFLLFPLFIPKHQAARSTLGKMPPRKSR